MKKVLDKMSSKKQIDDELSNGFMSRNPFLEDSMQNIHMHSYSKKNKLNISCPNLEYGVDKNGNFVK